MASARLEAAGEIAQEKRYHGQLEGKISEVQHRLDVALERIEDMSNEKTTLQIEIERLKHKLDSAICNAADAEKVLCEVDSCTFHVERSIIQNPMNMTLQKAL